MKHYRFYLSLLLIIFLFPSDQVFGQTWRLINRPTESNFLFNIIVLPNNVLAVDDIQGIWVTSNGGATWLKTLTTYNIMNMRGTNSLFVVGGIGGIEPFIYVSNETGTSWQKMGTDSINRPFVREIAERSPNEFFALGEKFGGNSPNLYRTTNGGALWFPTSTAWIPDLTSIVTGPRELVYGIQRYGEPGANGFYRSTDNGATWTQIYTGVTISSTFITKDLVADDQNTLFLPSTNGILLRSTDQGVTWQSITTSLPTESELLSLNICSSGEMYIGAKTNTQSTIHKSTDGGVTWNNVGDPIKSGDLMSMAVTPGGKIVALVGYDLYTNETISLTAPILVSPLNGSEGIPLITTLIWDNDIPTSLKYHIQISSDSLFSQSYIVYNDSTITIPQYKMPANLLKGSSKYFWRVSAINSTDKSSWSTIWSFSTSNLTNPNIYTISPICGQSITIPDTLKWIDSSHTAVSYGLKLSDDYYFSTNIIDTSGLTSSQFIIYSGLPNFKWYYWKVNYKNSQESTSPWSDICSFATGFPVGINNDNLIPSANTLDQNYPNPFNPTTEIKYSIASSSLVQLRIYNILGKEIATIVNGTKQPGNYSITFNASSLPSGIYFYKLNAGTFTSIKKMIVLK